MTPTDAKESLNFNYHAIRLIIGLIALTLPWFVTLIPLKILDSISWSYYTNARNIFVGFLFVIGAFLMSYKGQKPILQKDDLGRFWGWLSRFWTGAIAFRIKERKHEENVVGWLGGGAALLTALCPTAKCLGISCPPHITTKFHALGAIVLFSTTVYFCLVAFKSRAQSKIQPGKRNRPIVHRIFLYSFCGWGIVAIMLGLLLVKFTHLETFPNMTFWAEAFALELFGIAWLVASQYLPLVTTPKERQKLFGN